MSDYVNIQTPFARAGYVYLNKPDTKFGDAKYKVTLFFSKDDAQAVIDAVEEVITDNFTPKEAKSVKRPYKTDAESGEVALSFATKERPKVFDSAGNLIPFKKAPNIYSGSILRVNAALKANDDTKTVSRFLNQVQIKELVEGGGASGGFGAAEGGYTWEPGEDDEEVTEGFGDVTDEEGSSDPLNI